MMDQRQQKLAMYEKTNRIQDLINLNETEKFDVVRCCFGSSIFFSSSRRKL